MSGGKTSVEKSLLGEMHPTSWVVPVEMPVKSKKGKKSFRIGIPKEAKFYERRVPLTPDSVAVLVANGHEVFIQQGAGRGSNFPDASYINAGAHICYTLADIYAKASIIVKVSPLTPEELTLLRDRQTLISAVNLGSLTPETLHVLIKKNITALGFEFLQDLDGKFPLVQVMSEIAGVTSIHVASELLSINSGGKGILLGGISGVPPAVVTIIGAGTVGLNAARTAIGMGATVKVIDSEVTKLRELENILGFKIHTAVSQMNYIEDAVLSSDVVIGAAMKAGHRTPMVVTEEMVAHMKEGSVIVDVSIDQGGCIATSKLTSHENPTFVDHDVIHYCVPNIPSRVSNTASSAVSNILGPLLIQIGDFGGLEHLMRYNEGVREGIYVYHKHLTKQPLSAIFGIDYMDINLLVATDI